MKKYIVTMIHDSGIATFTTMASNREQAIAIVTAAEKAPRSAVLSAVREGTSPDLPVRVTFRDCNRQKCTVKLYRSKWVFLFGKGVVLRGEEKIRGVFVRRSIHHDEVLNIKNPKTTI